MEQREDKMLRVGKILREAVLNSTKSIGNWQKHLDFTAQFYKYGFLEQLLIESQRPNATVCATYDTWKDKLGRQVRDGANGIPLLTERNGRISMWHVFDVSDTVGNERSIPVKAWEMKSEHRAAVAERLGKGSLDGYISARIEEILKNTADKYINDIFKNRKDSLLDGLDRDNISLRFREIVKASAKYAIEKRCGLEPDFNAEDHKYIGDFNTRSLIIMLGKAVNGISSTVLREIEAQVKAYEKTLNKEEQHYEERLENEDDRWNHGSIQRTGTGMAARNEGRSGNEISARHGNDDIHTTNSTRTAGGIRTGDVGETPLELSEREQTRDVRRTGDGRSVGTSDIGGQESGRNVGDTSGADERSGGSERRTEEERPHGMGGETQRNKEQSPRDNIQRADIRINEKAGEQSSAFSDSEDIIGTIPYRFIKNKSYIKKDTETALAIADKLAENGIKYSGKINGDTTTLTVSGEDKERADSIADAVVKELRGFFNDEQIRIAKETNIVDYLASKGIKTKRVGSNEYTLEEHDSMRINGSKFYWNSQQMYGNALNFAINYLGMDFKTAVGDLLNFNGYSQYRSAGDFTPRPAAVKEKAPEEEKPHKVYLYPLVDDAEKVVEYLTKTRGLSEGLVRKMIDLGAISQDERGNAVFSIRGADGKVSGAELTGTAGAKFKRITERDGSGFAFSTTGKEKPKKAIFFESAIDAISYFALNPKDAALLVSMGGLKDKVVNTMLDRYKIPYENAYIAADNDEAGRNFKEKMAEKYGTLTLDITDDYRYKQLEQIGTEVKDWNELLVNSEDKKYEELAKAKVDEFKAKTAEKFKPIERTSLESLEFHLRNIVDTLADAYELDLDVVDVMVTGSRSRGIEDNGSDIDVLVAYNGDVREDHFFNILNDENETFEGLKIDFNPKKIYDMGDLAAYLIETDKYLNEKAVEKAQQTDKPDMWRYTETLADPKSGEKHYSIYRLIKENIEDYDENRASVVSNIEDKEACIELVNKLNNENITDDLIAINMGEEVLNRLRSQIMIGNCSEKEIVDAINAGKAVLLKDTDGQELKTRYVSRNENGFLNLNGYRNNSPELVSKGMGVFTDDALYFIKFSGMEVAAILDIEEIEKVRKEAVQQKYSKWDYTANPVGGEMLYSVYRLRDKDSIDYSGNREYPISYVEDKEICIQIAERLNAENIVDLESAKKIGEEMLAENEKAKAEKMNPYKTAKELISEYIDEEFSTEDTTETPDFSDLKEIGLAHTTVDSPTDEELTVQADADLIDREIRIYVDDILVKAEIFDNDTDFNARLANLSFGDLTFISDEMWKEYYNETSKEKGYDTEKTAGNIEPGDIFFINKKICTVVAADSSPLAMVSFERNIGGVDFLGTMPMKKERLINDGIFVGRDDSAVTSEPETKTPEEKIEAEDVPESKPETNEEDHTEMDTSHRIFRGRNDDELKLIYRKSPAELVTASITKESINMANDMAADAQHFFKLLEAYSNTETVRLGDLFYMQAENEYENGIPLFDALDNDTYNALVNFAKYGEFEKPEPITYTSNETKVNWDVGSWNLIATEEKNGKTFYEYENETFKDEIGHIIVDEDLYFVKMLNIGENIESLHNKNNEIEEDVIDEYTEDIPLNDYDYGVSGLWSVVDHFVENGETVYEMENNNEGFTDDFLHVIVDKYGKFMREVFLDETVNYSRDSIIDALRTNRVVNIKDDDKKREDGKILYKNRRVAIGDNGYYQLRGTFPDGSRAGEEINIQNLGTSVKEAVEYIEDNDLIVSGISERIMPDLSEREDAVRIDIHAPSIYKDMFIMCDDIEGTLYLGKTENYKTEGFYGVYDNSDNSLEVLSDGSKLYDLFKKGAVWSESREEAVEKFKFLEEDFVSFSALVRELSKKYQRIDAPSFAGQKIEPETYSRDDLKLVLNIGEVIYFEDDTNTSVIENARENNLVNRCIFSGDDGNFQMHADMIKNGSVIKNVYVQNFGPSVDDALDYIFNSGMKISEIKDADIPDASKLGKDKELIYDYNKSIYKDMVVMMDPRGSGYLGKEENYTSHGFYGVYDNSDNSLYELSEFDNMFGLFSFNSDYDKTLDEIVDEEIINYADVDEFKELHKELSAEYEVLKIPTFAGEPIISDDEPENNIQRVYDAVYSNYKGMMVMQDIDDNVYLGKRENYSPSDGYDNSDDSLVFVSSNSNIYKLLRQHCSWTETQTELMDGEVFTKEDFIEFEALRNGVLSQFKELALPTFDGEPFEPVEEAVPGKDENFIEPSSLDYSVYDGYSVMIYDDMVFMGETKNIDGAGRYDNSSDSIIHISGNKNMFTLLSKNSGIEPAPEKYIADGRFTREDFEELTEIKSTVLVDLKETFESRLIKPFYPENQDVVELSMTEKSIYKGMSVIMDKHDGIFLGKTENIDKFGNYNNDDDSLLYLTRNNAIYSLLSSENVWTEAQEEILDNGEAFDTDDFIELTNLIDSTLSGYEEEYPLTFAGKSFEPVYPEDLIGNSTTEYKIYQMKNTPENRGIRFEPYGSLYNRGIEPDVSQYDLVYEGKLESKEDLTSDEKLEKLFYIFNKERPDDFTGHSLSVSDVVVLNENDTETAHYVDDIGFADIPEFFIEKKIGLKDIVDRFFSGDDTVIETPDGEWEIANSGYDLVAEIYHNGIPVCGVINDLGTYEVEAYNSDVEDVVKAVTDVLKNKGIEFKKIYQVITNAGLDGGIDDKLEYATLGEAVKAGKEYLDDDYLGFAVLNTKTKKIEQVEGEFPLEDAFNEEILKINGIEKPVDREPITMRKVGDFWEFYGINARNAAETLGLTLTRKNNDDMCGFPDFAKDDFCKELRAAGYTVLIEEVFELDSPKVEKEPENAAEGIETSDELPIVKINIEADAEQITELKAHLENNGYDVKWSELYKSLDVDFENADFVETILQDRNIKYTVDTEDLKNYLDETENTADEEYILLDFILNNMPDPTMTVEDRNDYGYMWNGMLPLSPDRAKELFEHDHSIYQLGDDNTEHQVENADEISDSFMYGIEAEEWEKSLNTELAKEEQDGEIYVLSEEILKNMPDPSVTINDRNKYGYTWNGILPVTSDKAKELVDKFSVYELHRNNTADYVESANEILETSMDGTLYGISAAEWENHMPVKSEITVDKTVVENETEYIDDIIDAPSDKTENSASFSFANKGQNYKITDYNFNVAGPKERFKNNVAAIRLLKELEENGAQATPEQQEVLAKYVGWGGISMAFEAFRENWTEEYKELKELLTEDEYASASASVLNSHYTPPEVIETVYKGLENLGFAGGRILEPSMGVGAFFGMLPESMENSKLYGVELDSVSGRIAKQLYPDSNIQIKGFEKTGFTSNVFDVALGNVPFGNYKLSDTEFRRGNLIHDYFFKKALDKVHPGGIVAFITSKGTLDKRDDTVRRYLAERAELIGAIRLPNNVFSNANAKVVSDIIFLQKREEPLDLSKDENVPSWVKVKEIDEDLYTQKAVDYGNKIYINSYFAEHPEMIAGDLGVVSSQYGFDLTCKPRDYRSLSEDLDYIVKNIQGEYRQNGYDISEDLMSVREENDIIVENYRNFCYAVIDDEIYFRDNEIMEKQDFDGKKAERVKALVHLSGVLQELITAQREGCSDETLHKLQSKLNTEYDKFTDKYGLITNKLNRAAFRLDDTAELLASLENVNEKGELISKADIFTKRTIEHYVPVESVDTAVEALAVSISEKARVDLDFMSQLCSKTVEDIVEDLKGVIFKNPETGNYENADEYLSGNVRKKLEIAQLKAVENEEYAVNVEFLRSVQPEELKPEEITVQLGSTWVPVHYYEEFMYQLLDTPHSNRSDYVWRESDRNPFASRGGDNSTVTVAYDAETSTYGISNKSNYNAAYTVQASQTYGTSRVNAYKILEDTLNLKPVKVMDVVEDEFGKKKSVLNEKETLLAQQKQEEIKAAFAEWLFDDYERTQDICKIYNEKFNSVRPREYDGSHLNLVGMNSDIKLGKHQLNGIARTIYGGNTLLAHCVGAGKTYQMIASAMESKRLGLCHKSLIVVPKHIVKQVASDFMKLYPNANILLPAEGDFSKANRERFCSRIATGSYDAVIISHNQLEKIPISPERQERYLQDAINDIVAAIERMSDNEGDNGFSIKQLESKKKALQDRLEKLYDGKNKDSVVFFEELGVDRMYIDEAHLFKNLNFNTKMSNVAGINSSNPSKRASDVFMKCRYLDELTGSKGCVFATGTPLSNSMVELYIMQTFLQREKLKELGLDNFDAWASSFGSTTQALELAPEGKGYRMKTRFSKFFNIPELMKLFKETADIQTPDMLKLPVPEAEYITVATEASDFQIEMIDALAERAKAVRQGHVDPTVDNMLKITNEGRKLALDQRLANPLLPDDAESKVNQCINNVFNIWDETKPDRSTQMIFCDLSTPHYDGEFNVYDDIKQKLVDMGIPKEEIAFIHDCKTDDQKQKMFEKVNSGEIRILLGSTSKMGTGTNAQERLIAAHHLDTPWRPSDLNQREGRIIRRGNRNKKVKIFTYVTKNTFDSYLYQLVENKQRFISQIMTSKSPARSAEDVDEAVLSYAQIKAIASGDERIKEKMDLDIEVGRLRTIYSGFKETKRKQQNNIAKEYPQKIKFHTAQIEGIAKDIALVQANESEEFKEMTVLGVTHTDKKEAAEALLKACRSLKFGEHNKDVGTYKGFDMSVTFNARENSYELTLKGAVSHTLKVGADAFGNITRIENAMKKLPEELERHKLRLAETETALEEAKKVVDKPFPQLEELKIKEQRLEELNRIFADDSGGTPQNGSEEHSHDKSEHGRNDKYSR